MRGLWNLGGRVAFWVSWPLLYLYLRTTERTRIVVAVGDEVLVVRGWLSDGWWGLPGGGLHRGEDPAVGAIRELKEETGIEVSASKLQKLFTGTMKSERNLRYHVQAFGLPLKQKPKLIRQKFELTHLEWIGWKELTDNPRTAKDVRDLVLAFYEK